MIPHSTNWWRTGVNDGPQTAQRPKANCLMEGEIKTCAREWSGLRMWPIQSKLKKSWLQMAIGKVPFTTPRMNSIKHKITNHSSRAIVPNGPADRAPIKPWLPAPSAMVSLLPALPQFYYPLSYFTRNPAILGATEHNKKSATTLPLNKSHGSSSPRILWHTLEGSSWPRVFKIL